MKLARRFRTGTCAHRGAAGDRGGAGSGREQAEVKFGQGRQLADSWKDPLQARLGRFTLAAGVTFTRRCRRPQQSASWREVCIMARRRGGHATPRVAAPATCACSGRRSLTIRRGADAAGGRCRADPRRSGGEGAASRNRTPRSKGGLPSWLIDGGIAVSQKFATYALPCSMPGARAGLTRRLPAHVGLDATARETWTTQLAVADAISNDRGTVVRAQSKQHRVHC